VAAGFHSLQRQLAALLPGEGWLGAAAPVELSAFTLQDAPRLISATLLEDTALREHAIDGHVAPHFTAFLDGTQRSRVLVHAGEIPVVHGVVAAVIRHRTERRLHTWGEPVVRQALYAPLPLLPPGWRAALEQAEVTVTDTLSTSQPASHHPFALQDAAIHAVQVAREAAERELAERWCANPGGDLFVDGSITASERVATSACAIGVVKSHHTLYAEGEALRVVLRLRRGERTSIFRITSPRRTPVASWYLRVRDPVGHDPLWGLVRVEVAETSTGMTARADDVSGWVMAEALPLAVPDGRWDKMMYGIRDCEEFLRAIQ
jgi:hypothetical protein